MIINKDSNKCAQVDGASQDNGANISQWDCVDQDNVKWRSTPTGDGYVKIMNKASNKCAQVDGASQANGANISQWDCVDQDNVKWQISRVYEPPPPPPPCRPWTCPGQKCCEIDDDRHTCVEQNQRCPNPQ